MSNARNIANLPNGDDAPIYACRAWVNFRGTSQSGTATASGLITGLYTATVVTATQFTVEYSGTTYTINTSGNHEIGDGEGVDLTVSGTTVTIDAQIRKSGNVSSIFDNGQGNYTVNFTTAMSDVNYTAVGNHNQPSSGSASVVFGKDSPSYYSTTQLQLTCFIGDGVYRTDASRVTVAVFN